ncbi:MAG: thioredoxin family protein [Pseudomonadota bacterium]
MSDQSLVIATALLSALFATSLSVASPLDASARVELSDSAHSKTAQSSEDAHPEAKPYDERRDALADVDAALARAAMRGVDTLIIMGANWCHDSRGLAGHLQSARFAPMIAARYELVYVDIGSPQTNEGRNLDIAARFGVENISGTPNVLIVTPDGTLRNSAEDAKSWRNAASRDADDIFAYFAEL